MNLTEYYAKHNPNVPKNTASSDAVLEAIPLHLPHSRVSHYHFDDAPDSDVEEDDAQAVPLDELVLLVRQLRNGIATQISRDEIVKFNRTHRVECPGCTKQNRECRITASHIRCDACMTKRRLCLRTDVFNQWMIRHKFKLSWEKAGDMLKHGQQLLRDNPPPKAPRRRKTEAEAPRKPKTEEDATLLAQTPMLSTPTPMQVASTSREVRTSPRTPVPRVRKEPAGVVVSIEGPSGTRRRSEKRAAPLGPPRADHKRRKILGPEVPVIRLEPERHTDPELQPKPESAVQAGREILPAPSSVAASKKQVRLLVKEPTPAAETDAVLSARVTATEQRLDALEVRLHMSELGRKRVVGELNSVIDDLESTGDVRTAAERLRAVHASLLQEEFGFLECGEGLPLHDELLLLLPEDTQDVEQLGPVEPEAYLVDDTKDFSYGAPILGPDHSTVVANDTLDDDSAVLANDRTEIPINDNIETRLLENGRAELFENGRPGYSVDMVVSA
ncbi:hypothetical protein C8F04DRAFT_1091630 [Mycena alexandri]|uniref:Uncharacterized protein n=1 Tax=Mycena alexandri TaxID=1745969 RepID=A0AAD6T113_9AGAR|nr:hypothetical protein C8F04DRAFT_1091630 [Mycena alexandri]